jgi:hypothetical protein
VVGVGGGAAVFVVSVRWTVDDPSTCFVVVSFVSELVLFPVSVVVDDWVRVVVVDCGGVVPPQPAADTMRKADVMKKREELVICRRAVQAQAHIVPTLPGRCHASCGRNRPIAGTCRPSYGAVTALLSSATSV